MSEKPSGTPITRGSASRKAHRYSKLEAKPLRRSSVSAVRKSDRGTRRLFLQKRKPEEKKETKIVASSEAPLIPPPKPPRAHQVVEARKADKKLDAVEKSEENIGTVFVFFYHHHPPGS